MNKKRLLAIIITVMLIVGVLPLGTFVYADEGAVVTLVYTNGEEEKRNVSKIEPDSFSGNTTLKSVSVKGDLEYIGQDAFHGCTSLDSVSFSGNVGEIGARAFVGCPFTSVSFPGKVVIGDDAFETCMNLRSVSFKDAAFGSIGAAFRNGCAAFEEVFYNGTLAQWMQIPIASNWVAQGIVIHCEYNVAVKPDGGGTANANVRYDYDMNTDSGSIGVYVNAVPKDGYRFKNWSSESGSIVFNDANDPETYLKTIDPSATPQANFELIPPDDISTATVTASDQTYDGTEKKPVPTVTWNGKTLTEGTDFDVTAYVDNKDAGDATVTVTGKGKFAGTAKGTFKIAPAKATITVDNASKVEGESDPVFTGTVEGLIADGDLGEITYSREGSDEAPGTYKGVLTANYTDNPNYDVTVNKGDFTITEKPVYKAASGSGGTYTKGSGKTLTFTYKRSADDETTFSHFKGITVDGKAVPEKDASGKANWTAKKGSVIIELQSSYLETLSVGEHKLAVQFDDGADATSTFTVKAKPATPTKAATTSGKTTTTAPKTGDENSMMWWLLCLSASAVALWITTRRKMRQNV